MKPDPANEWREVAGAGALGQHAGATSATSFLPPPYPPSAATAASSLPVHRQPQGALSGVIVYCGAGHGLTADTDDKHAPDGDRGWYTQRPLSCGIIEDFGNIDQLNFLADYCFNAGATVVPFRPLGFQANEVVLDNDDKGVTFGGAWKPSASTIYYGKPGYVPYVFAAASLEEMAMARYTPNLPEAGFYPVYAWARQGADRTRQLYRVIHSGGIDEVRVDHRRVGRGWVWLGTYYFDAGTGGAVEISNQMLPEEVPAAQNAAGSVVIADAIRFGNGKGDTDRGTGVSGFPREFEASRYWVERMLGQGGDPAVIDMSDDDQADNVGTPPRMAAAMNRESEGSYWDRIYMGFHTNAGGRGRGALGLFNGTHPTQKQREYATIVHDQLDSDMRALGDGVAFLGRWDDNGGRIYGGINYGEIRDDYLNSEMTATILEVAFHDKPDDAELLKQAAFRHCVGRSAYKGIVKFLNMASDGRVPAAVLPDPPTHLRARTSGPGTVTLAWDPPASSPAVGGPAAGYIVYASWNGFGFGAIQMLQGEQNTTATLTGLPAGRVAYFCVTAINAGGESLESRTVAIRVHSGAAAPVLLIDGVQEYDVSLLPTVTVASGLGSTKASGGTVQILRPLTRNSFEALLAHAAALDALGIDFDFCDSAAAADRRVALDSYKTVVWILGKDTSLGSAFADESRVLKDYLGRGGHLLATGRAIPWPIVTPEEVRASFTYDLQPTPLDSAGQMAMLQGGAWTIFADLSGVELSIAARDVVGPRATDSPESLRSLNSYFSLLNGFAGIQGDTGRYRVVNLGIPLQGVVPASSRAELVSRSRKFLEFSRGTVQTSPAQPR